MWVNAIVYKGNQLVELNNSAKFTSSSDINADFTSMKKYREINSILATETHFFLTSVIKAKQWLDKIECSNEEIKAVKNLFTKAHLARNVREHDNEYQTCKFFTEEEINQIFEQEKDKKKKIWYWQAIVNIKKNGKDKIFSMLWTGIISGKFYIGNIDVSEMVSMAEKILPYLNE